MNDLLVIGTTLANELSAEPVKLAVLANLGDLLELFPKPVGPGAGAPIHSAAANFVSFIGTTADQIPFA